MIVYFHGQGHYELLRFYAEYGEKFENQGRFAQQLLSKACKNVLNFKFSPRLCYF